MFWIDLLMLSGEKGGNYKKKQSNFFFSRLLFFSFFFLIIIMYPLTRTSPPSQSDDEEYALDETRFVERGLAPQSPFLDQYPNTSSYSVETHEPPIMPLYDNQPLLNHDTIPMTMPMPMPIPGRYPNSMSPVNPVVLNDSAENVPVFFTGAPKRQPRRYTTSKFFFF